MKPTKEKPSNPYTEIARYFLKLGVLGFGGPLALMAACHKDLVKTRRWISEERFARALALIKALPGPTGTQMAVYMGQAHGGKIGGLIAGICLIFPSFIMMLCLAAFYSSVVSLSWSSILLFGMQAAAMGVIIESVWKLSAAYRKEVLFWVLVVLAGLITYFRPSAEPVVIVGFGIFGMLLLRMNGKLLQGFIPLALAGGSGAIALGSNALASLLGVCLKAGALVFGTGLAIVPLLAHDVIDQHHWLTQREFMDALAFGQITPGPVVITSTFIGYKVAGLLGAVVATAGIFSPAFFNILTWFPLVEKKFGGSPYAKRFVMWAVAGVLGSILVTVFKLSLSTAATPIALGFDYGAQILFAVISIGALAAALLTDLPVWLIIPAGGGLAASALLYQYI